MKLPLILIPFMFLSINPAEKGNNFSQMEINHIRVATPGLFTDNNELDVHLENLQDTEYCFPLEGGKVISPYGRGHGRHSGTDIKTCARDTIRSAFDGVVRMSKSYSGYGKVIVIRHPFGLETVYSHNCKNFVKSGDTVKAGQPVALTGRTGRATTEHLHFETRINGQHFNPGLVFDFTKNKLRKVCLHCIKKGKRIIVKSE